MDSVAKYLQMEILIKVNMLTICLKELVNITGAIAAIIKAISSKA